MIRMDIRCCCTPGKLLGSVPVRDETTVGEKIKFLVTKPSVRFDPLAFQHTRFDPTHVTLEVAEFGEVIDGSIGNPGRLRKGLALKSGELPIEVLSRIPGFIPAEMPSLSSLATKDPSP